MSEFERLLRDDTRNEVRIFRCEIAVVVLVVLLVFAYFMIA